MSLPYSHKTPQLPDASVVVAVFNAEETICDCIESLLRLDYPRAKLELIVVNNASTDRTAALLDHYRHEIKLLYEAKKGPAAARNKGILNAQGCVVAFTDSDCVVDRGWLRALVAPLSDPRIGIAGGSILSKRPCNHVEQYGERIHDHHQAIQVYTPPYAITMNWASRLSVLEESSLFDEDFMRCQDVDLSYRIHKARYDFSYVPEAVVYHRNESTLCGLFGQGFLHGHYSVQALKKHQQFLKGFGHRRFNASTYLSLGARLADYLRGREPEYSACDLAFNLGKKVGKISGSIRFGHLEL